MNETLTDVARNVLLGVGILVAAAALARGVPARVAIGLGLELWLAGGLIKLSSALISWQSIAMVAALLSVRKMEVMVLASTQSLGHPSQGA